MGMLRRLAAVALAALSMHVAGSQPEDEVAPGFKAGTLRLQQSMFGQGVAGGAGLKELYDKKEWPQLVKETLGKRFISDLYYFYLGAAAEGMGYGDAALIYYKFAIAFSKRGDTCNFGFDSCRGIAMPKEAADRISLLATGPRNASFMVVDASQRRLTGARVEIFRTEGPSSCVTDEGACSLTFTPRQEEEPIVVVTSIGMLPASVPVKRAPTTTPYSVVMAPGRDYLCDELRQSGASSGEQLADWAATIWTQARLVGTTLQKGGICMTEFKQRRYAALILAHDTVYNQLKLNDYAIGVKVFDEVIRKMLGPMSSARNDLPIDGFDISVVVGKGDPLDKKSLPKANAYRFYLTREQVQKYRDKDITGQQLIDTSVVLLQDERIDLRLQ